MQDWTSYDAVAPTYARVHAPRFEDPAHALAELVTIAEGQRVLDVGTGTGVAAEAARGRGAQVVGIDASLRMLAEGRRTHDGLPLVAAEALDLPFRGGSFDAVLGSFVLAHFARIDTAMYELLRVTRPGGRHGFTSWADAPDTFIETWLELVYRAVPREMLEPTLARAIPNHERFRRPSGLESGLYDAGLRKVRVERRVRDQERGAAGCALPCPRRPAVYACHRAQQAVVDVQARRLGYHGGPHAVLDLRANGHVQPVTAQFRLDHD